MNKILACIVAAIFITTAACSLALAGGDKCNDFTFDATKSRAYGGDKLNYHWDFGDGTTSDKPVVTHRFEKAGNYTVRLTVTDSSGLPCDSAAANVPVKVNVPPTSVFNGPDMACTGSEIRFDASSSRSEMSRDMAYHWTFGDGTSAEGVTVKKVYEKGGNYKVQLIVDDNLGTECSTECSYLNVKVNTPPTANAGGKDINMTCMKTGSEYAVRFSGSGSDADGDKLTYTWNFGDGTSAEGASATHVYAKGGSYRATLTVDDGSGSGCSMASDSINVNLSKAPRAFAGNDMKACVGSQVDFDGTGSVVEEGQSVNYTWDFGDGATGTGIRTSHSYSKGGKHTAILTVDSGECKSSDSVMVEVNSSPMAALADVEKVCVGDKVILDASGSRDPDGDGLSYTWDFGDGELVNGKATECRIYEKGGTYTARVTVDDGKGTPCSTSVAATIVKVNTRPIAMLKPSDACCVGVESMFDASGSSDPDGDSLSYSWSFGDGSTATGPRASHVYNSPGRYKVSVTVDDGSGTPCSLSSAATDAVIHENPNAVISVR